MRFDGMLGAAVLLFLAACQQPALGFVRVQGGRFVDAECNDIAIVGANTWRILESQAGLESHATPGGLTPTEWLFKTSANENINLIRMFATGVTGSIAVQPEAGQYNEEALKALDGALDIAAKQGVYVTLALSNNWNPPDSRFDFARWAGVPVESFFDDPKAMQFFKDHISFLANRKNSINGRIYKNDPIIFSWNLMNEPRFFGNDTRCINDPGLCANIMDLWISTMASHLKSVDPNHLVSIGSEGFFAKNSAYAYANPTREDWLFHGGQDFERNTAHASIDYAEIHMWPHHWKASKDFTANWIKAHSEAAAALGKPLMLEEFGFNVTNPFNGPDDPNEAIRRDIFKTVFAQLKVSIQSGGNLRGAMYWMFDPIVQTESSPGFTNYKQDLVPVDSYIFKDIIRPAASEIAAVGERVRSCTPLAVSSFGRKLMTNGV